jgi:hypothetical protein
VEFSFIANPLAQPNAIAALVMLLWLPCVVCIFNVFPARRAIVISFITAWLFLPEAQFVLGGLPNYTKVSATCFGILIATIIFDVQRFNSFRFGLLDLPMLIWCITPFVASVSNGLGAYDGVSATLNQTITWGVPYFLGRIYLNDFLALRQMAIGMFVGGLIYVPLCLFEVRMSPQLHRIFYGGHAHMDFAQTMRYDGFRPSVFLVHGLAVGAWMMAASLIGVWLWRTKSLKTVRNVPLYVWVPILLVTMVLVKSTGALFLLVLGLGVLYTGVYFRTAIPVYALAVGIAVYLLINTTTDNYFTDQLLEYASRIFPEDRVASLNFRFDNEEILTDKARQRFWLGWGGWGRALIFDESGRQLTIPDSLWIIAFGNNGMLGLASLFSALLLPPVALFMTKCRPQLWERKDVGPAVAVAIALLMYVTDCLLNAMVNPIYILACGGIAGLVMRSPVPATVPRVARSRAALPGAKARRSLPQASAASAVPPSSAL